MGTRALLVGSAFAASLAVGCGKSTPSASMPDGARPADAGGASTSAAPASSVDPTLERLWVEAKGTPEAGAGEAAELARLADREGAGGLAQRAQSDPAYRLVALRAMAFAPEPGAFAGLQLLGEAASGSDDAQADAALDSAIDLAARPRLAIDPEDFAEMKAGCTSLLSLARDGKAARARRVKAIRALRMLADRGCVDPGLIPADLDAR